MLVWTTWACTTGPAVLPKGTLVRQQALPGSAWARVTARSGVLVVALAWLLPYRPREQKNKVHERQQLEWVEPSLFARQFWFTSHLKGSRWFLSLPEPRVPGMCVCVSAGVHVSSDQIHLTKFCGVLLCLNQANGISCTFQHCSAKNVQDQKIMWNHVKQTS